MDNLFTGRDKSYAGQEASEADIIDHCSDRIAGYRLSKALCFVWNLYRFLVQGKQRAHVELIE